MNNGGEILFADGFELPGHDSGHDEDALGEPGGAEGDAFVNGTNGQPFDAFTGENAGDFDGSMAVGIGFNDADHTRFMG